jgi:PRTRC genetic system protein B
MGGLLDLDGAIYFVGGQAIFEYHDHAGWHYKPIGPETLKVAFSVERLDSGWIPKGIVRSGFGTKGYWFVKFLPPDVHQIEMTYGDETLKIKVPLPALIFAGINRKYYLWAVQQTEFDPKAPMPPFQAPLPNLYSDGSICWGSNQPPEARHDYAESAWQLFITSPFNSHLAGQKSSRFDKDVRMLLKELAATGLKHYPLDDLRPVSFAPDADIEDLLRTYIWSSF